MSTFAEKLAAGKAAPRPHADVTVLLDADLVAERDRLQAIIGASKSPKAPAKVAALKELEELMATAGDALVTLRFTQLPGNEWTALTSKCPPRPFVPVDVQYGYDYDAATIAAARFVDASGRAYGTRLEGDEEVALIVEAKSPQNPEPTDEWADLLSILSGHEIRNIRNTIWGLNEYLPKLRIEQMGKAFGATARSEKN